MKTTEKIGNILNGTIEKRFIFRLGTPMQETPFMVQYTYNAEYPIGKGTDCKSVSSEFDSHLGVF